jgi:drug/metabolite transporter (DMT)-like permease
MVSDAIGILAALGSAASWAMGAFLFKRLGLQIPPVPLTLAKSTLGLVILAVVAFSFGPVSVPWTSLLLLLFSGFLGIAVADALFFKALNAISAHTVVQMMTLGQILTIFLAYLFLQEPLSPTTGLSVTAIIGGVALVSYSQVREEGTSDSLPGLVAGLLSVVAMALSVIVAKLGVAGTDALSGTLIRMLGGVLGALLLFRLIGQGVNPLVVMRSDAGLSLRFVGAVSLITFGGFFLSLLAIQQTSVAIANTLIGTEPLFVLLFGLLLRKERLTLARAAGTGLSLFGIGALSLPEIL